MLGANPPSSPTLTAVEKNRDIQGLHKGQNEIQVKMTLNDFNLV